MPSIATVVRRVLLVVIVAAAGGGAYAWWRDRRQNELAPPEWPPLDPVTRTGTAPGSSPAPADAAAVGSNDDAAGGWVDPLDDGTCPLDHPIKANDNSGIFHVPEGRFYHRTKAERCYSSADAATADGYRQAKH